MSLNCLILWAWLAAKPLAPCRLWPRRGPSSHANPRLDSAKVPEDFTVLKKHFIPVGGGSATADGPEHAAESGAALLSRPERHHRGFDTRPQVGADTNGGESGFWVMIWVTKRAALEDLERRFHIPLRATGSVVNGPEELDPIA